MATKKIKILHLEDEETDADLVRRVLINGNIEAEIKVVDNKEEYVEALIEFGPEVILADHSLPLFNSKEAITIFHQTGMNIPFILVTDNISEEYAVWILKAGADDYILKNDLQKLPEAIVNSLAKIEKELTLENEKKLHVNEKTEAILIAHEEERSQMANELLENINQILAASNLYIDCALSGEEKRISFIQKSKKYLLMAIDGIKNLSQVIIPPALGEIGLSESINTWTEFLQRQTGMKFFKEWKNIDERLIRAELQLAIYRITQEQINNTVKYYNAQNVYISLEQMSDSLSLTIKDDGDGFDASNEITGVGLKNIKTRAELYNGTVLLESQPGKGCLLTVKFSLW